MSENGGERKFFGNIAKNQTGYGSTTKPTPKFTRYVKHIVSRVDTLMGISLKYAATVEQIKRENKLWTNDSLFLREHLYVPITIENSHLVQDNWELLTSDEVRSRSNSEAQPNSGAENRNSKMSSSSFHYENETEQSNTGGDSVTENQHGHGKTDSSQNQGANNSESETSKKLANGGPTGGMDFFSKYDTSIADLKNKVDTLEKTSSYRDDNLLSLIPRRHSEASRGSSRSNSQRTVSLEIPDGPDSPVLIIRSHTRSHKVQTQVKKSEAANDNLYQL